MRRVLNRYSPGFSTLSGLAVNPRAFLSSLLVVLVLASCGAEKKHVSDSHQSDKSVVGVTPSMRRITQAQYANIIADVFGRYVTKAGLLEPDLRQNNLIAVGTSVSSVTASGFERYDTVARDIAKQVLENRNFRKNAFPCRPRSDAAADNVCSRLFIAKIGELLFRRPLSAQEVDIYVNIAAEAAGRAGDFYAGMELSLAAMMVSPNFLFTIEKVSLASDGTADLDDYSRASRLSFFLWNTMPDLELLQAAKAGDLQSRAGLEKQVDRMLQSPKLHEGARAFFEDMFELDRFDTISKDTAIYPGYSSLVAEQAREQTLKTVIDLLIDKKGDYRDIFTTRDTFLTPVLASVYNVSVPQLYEANNGWARYRFDEPSERAGILTHISFNALHSHPGRTSPTLRGRAVRETLLCQKVPDPPGNVSFNIVQDVSNENYKTVRQRLNAHATEAMCVGCHKITDPIGLALENFDTIGTYRVQENGALIDPSGRIDGVPFDGPVRLGQALHDSPAAASCVVNRLYAYAVGRTATKAETVWLKEEVEPAFATGHFNIVKLMKTIAMSTSFHRAAAPPG